MSIWIPFQFHYSVSTEIAHGVPPEPLLGLILLIYEYLSLNTFRMIMLLSRESIIKCALNLYIKGSIFLRDLNLSKQARKTFHPAILLQRTTSNKKTVHWYNTISANFFGYVFFSQNLMFCTFKIVQICHRWRHIRDTILAQKHYASIAYGK